MNWVQSGGQGPISLKAPGFTVTYTPRQKDGDAGMAKEYGRAKPQVDAIGQMTQADTHYDMHTNVPASPPPPQLLMMDPSLIHADPATYQFRANCNEQGITEEHRLKADRWDPILQGQPLLVHQRKNGEYYIVDGHHRLDLAMRSNAQGQGPGNVAAQVLREADGYTAQDARIIAAYSNLQHHLNRGNGSNAELVDGARAFREAKTVAHPEWLPSLRMDSSDMRVSYKVAQMSDYAFGEVTKGAVPARAAAMVAEALPDQAQQDRAIKLIEEKLAQKNYDIRMQSGGVPVPQDGRMVLPFIPSAERNITLPQRQPEQVITAAQPGFADRVMAQREAHSAMAR